MSFVQGSGLREQSEGTRSTETFAPAALGIELGLMELRRDPIKAARHANRDDPGIHLDRQFEVPTNAGHRGRWKHWRSPLRLILVELEVRATTANALKPVLASIG